MMTVPRVVDREPSVSGILSRCPGIPSPATVVQWAAIVRAALFLGCTAALLSGIIGIAHVGAAHSETNAPPSWVDPDRFTDPPLVAAEQRLPTSASTTLRTLSWDFLDHMARALTPDQRIRAFETIESLLHAGKFLSASKLLERFEGVTLDRPQSALRLLLEAKTLYMSRGLQKSPSGFAPASQPRPPAPPPSHCAMARDRESPRCSANSQSAQDGSKFCSERPSNRSRKCL